MINVFIIALTFLNVRAFEEIVYEKTQLGVELTGDNYVAILGLGSVQMTLDFDYHGLTYRSEETTKNQGIFVVDHENKVVSGEFYHTYTFENDLVGAKSDIFVENGHYVRQITDDHSDWEEIEAEDEEEEIDTSWWHGENGISNRRSLSGEIEYSIKWYYTAAAVNEAGSLTALERRVLQGNADSNIAYANSGLNLKVFTAGDLIRWNTPVSDWKGQWRNRLTTRQRDEGDIVALIVGRNEGGGWCGVASTIPTSTRQYRSSSAFFAIKVDCLTGYVPAHEVGHLQGLSHNYGTTHCIGTACGNIIKCGASSAGGRRTVMSYRSISMINGGSARSGFPCTRSTAGSELRTPYFSSPNVRILIDGRSFPTGHSGANSVQTIRVSMRFIPHYATNEPGGGQQPQPNCNFVALTSSQCPTDNGRSLPDCSLNMLNGDLCEADSPLPNGDSNFDINNCGSFDVFKFVCSGSVQTRSPTLTPTENDCDFVALASSECPTDNGRSLLDCSWNMSHEDLCEADSVLPNGNSNFDINNCGNFDVFKYVCSDSTTSPTLNPTIEPTSPTLTPTLSPTLTPTQNPTLSPTSPTLTPTLSPTLIPTQNPTLAPTTPTVHPTMNPTTEPTTAAVCNWVAVSSSECPDDNGQSLADCELNMNEGELCEADSTLPNGETNYNINNCGNYDVFRYTCSSNRVATWRHVGFGGCTGGNWFKIGTANNLEEAKQLMLNHNQCKNEGSMLFYSGYSYSVSWSVRCALAGHHEHCTERNSNWQEYILTYGDSTPEADYVIGEKGVNSCPSHYVPISEPGACSTASTALSLTYDASSNDGSSDGVCNLCMGCNPATTRVDNDHGLKAHFICQKKATYSNHGTGKCQTSGGSDPAHEYLHGSGLAGCESSCDSRSDCFGYSVSSSGNCLLWLEDNLVGGGSNWGNAKCFIKNSRRQLSESHIRAELRAKTPSSLERTRKH